MLRLVNIAHSYGDVVSLRGVSLELSSGEILCLPGPSGCGKTTLLRIIAGLEGDYTGDITLDGANLRQAPAHERGFGLMFQDFALFPHMSVAQNIAYGLKRRGHKKGDIERRVGALLEKVGLPGLGGRDVNALSGGQKQRVALARSLAPNPRLLMLDEPLGSLDAQLRDALALDLRRLIKDAGTSAIYVTHDRREAYAVADRIAVMNMGLIHQCDTPQSLYHAPADAHVARFLGFRNIFGRENETAAQLARKAGVFSESTQRILIHPRGIGLTGDSSAAIRFDAALESAVFRGEYWDIVAQTDDGLALAFSVTELPANPGDRIAVSVSLNAILAFDQ